MNREALRSLAQALPVGSAVPVPRDWLLELLEVPPGAQGPDYTVSDVAGLFDRQASTVRAWCEEGRLPGAFKLRGREWRIPREAVEAFRRAEREGKIPVPVAPDSLGDWRSAPR